MEERAPFRYCRRCQADEPTFSFQEEEERTLRCLICGFPVETTLALEGDGVAGIPSPPEVRILCVDDDPLIRQMFGDILRFRGYGVLEASDGEAALQVAEREPPDLILLDIMMPGIDGFEVCRRLKADPNLRSIPVVILTAMNDPALNTRAFQVGAELALRKPAETAIVLRTIEAALGLAGMRRSKADLEDAGPASAAPLSHLTEPDVEASMDLGVPTRPAGLKVWTVDGAVFDATIFLHLNAETHDGPETVQDRLNDPNLFLTLTVSGDTPVLFLNKIQIVRVDLTAEAPPTAPAHDLSEVSIEPVRVQLINAEQLSGTVRIEGPAGRRRLSDFLNTQPAFLPLSGTDRLHLLQKRFIVRIIPGSA
ncbi:MAG: response regulator [candidate division NC10 bacterium]|nr:response regulator [candidate division NC10 bacterium]